MGEPAKKQPEQRDGGARPERHVLRSALAFLAGPELDDEQRSKADELPGALAFLRARWKEPPLSGAPEGFFAKYRRLSRDYQDAKASHAENYRVYETIAQAARLSKEFLALLVSACVIATFGLFADSAATVIGAMLIAPLMMPILGFALATIWGDTRLLWRSLGTLAIGTALAILVGVVLGVLVPGVELTGQIAARGNPSLYDLMVAIGSGLIGAYAFVNPRISPSIAGVAIAVALVPPLCSVGAGLALGEGGVAMGAMLLFLSNLIGISLAASLVFWRLRVHPTTASERDVGSRAKRNVAVSSLLLVLIATPLVYFMQRTIDARRQEGAVHAALSEELPDARVLALRIDPTAVDGVLLLPPATSAAAVDRARARIATALPDGASVRLSTVRAEER